MAPEDHPRIADRPDTGHRNRRKRLLLAAAHAALVVALLGLRGAGLGEASAQSSMCSNAKVPSTAADLIIAISAAPDPTVVEGNLLYTIRVQNCGPANASGVTVLDPLPASTTFVSVTQTAGATPFTLLTPSPGGSGTLVGQAPLMLVGDVSVFQLIVRVNP